MSYHTMQALRQAVFAALTSPTLTYSVNGSAAIAIPAASIQPFAPWSLGETTAADPLICFAVEGHGVPSEQLSDRLLTLRWWISSASGDTDALVSIYEAIRERLDSETAEGVVSWSRVSTSTTLPVMIRGVREIHALPPEYEIKTQRWWMSASWRLVAL